jgi:transposase
MDLHANAVLTVRQRQRVGDLVGGGVSVTAAALAVGCSRQTASKWVGRARRGEGLRDQRGALSEAEFEAEKARVLRARAE